MLRHYRSLHSTSFFSITICALVGLSAACDPSSLIKVPEDETTEETGSNGDEKDADGNADGDPNADAPKR